MSKALTANCAAGVVLVGGLPLPGATVLSEGVGPSDGVAILDGASSYYVAKISPDLKTTLDKLISVLTELTTVLPLIDAKPTGGTGSATTPVTVSSVANLTAISVQLTALKETLR